MSRTLTVAAVQMASGSWQTEDNMDRAEWRISTERIKMREAHIAPMTLQALKLLQLLHLLTGFGVLLFPAMTNHERPMSKTRQCMQWPA